MRLLEQAQKEHGKLKWNQLFGEAIGLADNGFRIPGVWQMPLQVMQTA